jgi:hypothetical protein
LSGLFGSPSNLKKWYFWIILYDYFEDGKNTPLLIFLL